MSDVQDRLRAGLADRYRIERELGSGGMAVVYLAHDVRHDRRVALKVLRPELAAVVGADRFLAEIRTTANLQHPHILPLFDSGQADGFLFYVMPYVEGESLRARLERERQLSIEEAVRIASSVAQALAYAHRHGIIHRDVKPENILLHDGEPLVADFGIALAVAQAGAGRVTETGLSLGTPHYMSPEQATGERSLGPRTDVYALGCVLYEMLVGEPPYAGPSAQAVLAKILTDTPKRVRDLRRSTPRNVDAVVAHALEKLPADRIETPEAFARGLGDVSYRHGEDALATPSYARTTEVLTAYRRQPALLALGVFVAIAGTAAAWGLATADPAPILSSVVRVAEAVPGGFSSRGRRLAISPDGTLLAYPGFLEDGQPSLYVRRLSEQEGSPVPGVEGETLHPEFSPDGRSIAFFRGNALMKVSVDGGTPLLLAREPLTAGRTSSWGDDGQIYFAGTGSIYRVPATGGASEVILAADSSARYLQPEALPGGRGLLLTANTNAGYQVRVVELATGTVRTLVDGGVSPRYVAATGHVVFSRDQILYAVPFDLRRLEVTGPPSAVLAPLATATPTARYDFSENGTAVYEETGALQQLVIFESDGRVERLPIEAINVSSPRFSPDGGRIAYQLDNAVYVYDLSEGTQQRLTFEGQNGLPVWSPDGRSLVYASAPGMTSIPADGSGQATLLSEGMGPAAWAPDGRIIARATNPQRGDDLFLLSFEGDSPLSTPLLTDPWNESGAALSPDGRWMAYHSDESGQFEVYVRSFPGMEAKRPISDGGGREPVWSPDGRTLYYWGSSGDLQTVESELHAVSIRTQPTFSVISREVRLREPARKVGIPNTPTQYAIHPDGDRFAVVRVGGDGSYTLVVNWFEELRARTAGAASR